MSFVSAPTFHSNGRGFGASQGMARPTWPGFPEVCATALIGVVRPPRGPHGPRLRRSDLGRATTPPATWRNTVGTATPTEAAWLELLTMGLPG